MSEASLKPVIAELETLFSKFNAWFFENKLESPVITVSPDHTRGAYGWCTSWKAWQNGAKEGGFYEINLCAEYLNHFMKKPVEPCFMKWFIFRTFRMAFRTLPVLAPTTTRNSRKLLKPTA